MTFFVALKTKNKFPMTRWSEVTFCEENANFFFMVHSEFLRRLRPWPIIPGTSILSYRKAFERVDICFKTKVVSGFN